MGNGNRIVGLILAAGYSSRMGAFKPLLPIGDETAVERISDTLKKAGIHKIIGVTGFQRERLSSIFARKGIIEAYNPDFDAGMFTSIKTGIRNALGGLPENGISTQEPEKPDGFFLMLVDCPLVPKEVLEEIMDRHRENPEAFILPCYHGKNGHPLFIPAVYAEEILSYEGEGGLKAVRDRHSDSLIRLETGKEAVVLDMDTPEGYQEILEFYRKQSAGSGGLDHEDLITSLQGKRLFLIRHGETRQHREKIFLGQTDIPLSDRGRGQAVKAGKELLACGISANHVYTSDLSRAAETAEIIADMLSVPEQGRITKGPIPEKIKVIRDPMLREISLGEWDGRFVSEICDQYPEEYRKRGENLLTYKYGNDSENFYDLQYRAMKGFGDILKKEREAGDGCRDIIIVSHSGVINVMLSTLRGTKLEEEINNRIPNGGVVISDYANAKEK